MFMRSGDCVYEFRELWKAVFGFLLLVEGECIERDFLSFKGKVQDCVYISVSMKSKESIHEAVYKF